MANGRATVYFGRHGHTEYNTKTGDSLDSRIRGFKNVPLDEEGRKQAKEEAQKFKDIKVAEIYSSDLDRAADTAREIAKVTGAPLYLIPNLRPWDLGNWAGEFVRDHEKELEALQQKMDTPAPGGRSYGEFYNRAVKIVKWLKERAVKMNEAGKGAIVAISHSRLLLALPCIIHNGDPRTIPQGGGATTGQVLEIQKEDGNWALRTLDDEVMEEEETQDLSKKGDYASLKRGKAMKMDADGMTDVLVKTARVLCESDHPNADQDLQAIVGDPTDVRTSTFAQFTVNPGTLQLPNPLSPIQGDEVFFAYMLPGAVFQAHDGSEWNILYYGSPDEIQIENRWYPRIQSIVAIGDIRRSIHQWIEPVTQTVPPPPPGVDYSALPVKIMDNDDNVGDIDQLTDKSTISRGSSW